MDILVINNYFIFLGLVGYKICYYNCVNGPLSFKGTRVWRLLFETLPITYCPLQYWVGVGVGAVFQLSNTWQPCFLPAVRVCVCVCVALRNLQWWREGEARHTIA